MSAPLDTLKSVTQRFADHYGCQVHRRESDLWEIRLSDGLRRKHRTDRWVLCFHRDLLGADPDAQLVSPGSPVLQRMREALEAETPLAEAVLKPAVAVPSGVPPGFAALEGGLGVVRREPTWSTLVRFQFRLVVGGAERQEEFFPVVLDAHRGVQAEATLKWALERTSPEEHPVPVQDLWMLPYERLVDIAFTLAEEQAAPLVTEVEDLRERAAQAEIHEAEGFFRESIKTESDPERRRQLQEFQAGRLQEIRERNQVHAELEPRGAVLFRLPATLLELEVRSGGHKATFHVELDQVGGVLTVPRCRHHPDTELRRVGLCADHGIHCEKCHWACTTCARPGCPDCARVKCPECSGRHCRDCVATCVGCRKTVGKEHLVSCASGCGLTCRSCAVAVAGGRHCRLCAEACWCSHGELKARVARSTSSGHSYCRACAAQHLGRCEVHGDLVEASALERCQQGGERACPRCRKVLTAGGSACLHHAVECSCGCTVLADQAEPCGTHGSSCVHCRWTCASCREPRCAKCRTQRCRFCEAMHCQGCVASCTTCKASVGREHLAACPSGCGLACPGCAVVVSGRPHCRQCSFQCDCGRGCLRSEATVSVDSGRLYCPACRSSKLFRCARSGAWSEVALRVVCAGGGESLRKKFAMLLTDGRLACPDHAYTCSCRRVILAHEALECRSHGTWYCRHCSFQCATCRERRNPRCCGVVGSCTVCAGAHCQGCLRSCQTCGSPMAKNHLAACGTGCGDRCPACLVKLPHEGNRLGCPTCAVTCSRCGCSEARTQSGTCGFCSNALCRACMPQVTRCSACGGAACDSGDHLSTCVGGDPVCRRCACTCHVCSRPACGTHGGCCPDCSRWVCSENTGVCRLCQTRLCSACLGPGGACLLCQALTPLTRPEDLAQALDRLESAGRSIVGPRSVATASSKGRVLIRVRWLLSGEKYFALDKQGRLLNTGSRGLVGRLFNRNAEKIE